MENKSNKKFFYISSFQILAMFRRGLFYTYLSIYLRYYLGLTVTETTLFATLPMILNIVFQTLVWGPISDKFQKRRTLIILGEVFASVSTVFVWFFHKLPSSNHVAGYVIIIGLTIVEIFWSMSNVGWTAIISDMYSIRVRSSIQGKLRSIGAIGNFIGIWFGGLAYDGLSRHFNGWGFSQGLLFFVASGVMLISTIPMFFIPEGGVVGISSIDEGRKEIGQKVKNVLSYSRAFIIFLIAMVFINFGRNSVALLRAQYLTLPAGFAVSCRMLSYIANTAAVAMFITGLFVGMVSKVLKDERVLFLGSLLAILYLLGFVFAKGLAMVFISYFLAGMSEVLIFASSYSYVSKLIPPSHRGKQFALFNATFFLSWGIGATFIAGPIADLLTKAGKSQMFSYQMAFLAAAILVVLGIFMLVYAYKRVDKVNTQ